MLKIKGIKTSSQERIVRLIPIYVQLIEQYVDNNRITTSSILPRGGFSQKYKTRSPSKYSFNLSHNEKYVITELRHVRNSEN